MKNTNKIVILASTLAFLFTGCGDETTTSTADSTYLTLSGYVQDGQTKEVQEDAEVILHIDGGVKTTRTDKNGGFHFNNISKDSKYFIEVKDINPNDNITYAPLLTSAQTTKSTITTIENIGALQIYQELNATLEVRDAKTGELLSGFFLYTDPLAGALNGIGQTLAKDINGSYTFELADNGLNNTVYLSSLKNGSIKYKFVDPTLQLNNVTTLKAGEKKVLYLQNEDTTKYSLTFHLVDENGTDTTSPYKVLPIINNVTGKTLYIQQDTQNASQYKIELSKDDIGVNGFSFTLMNFDSDNDGFNDTAAQHIKTNQTAFTFDKDSFDTTTKVATVPVVISKIKNKQVVSSKTLSDTSKIYAGVENTLIIGFDRPINVVTEPQISFKTLESEDVKIAAISNPNILDTDKQTILTTGDANLSHQVYIYDNDNNSTSKTDVIADEDGNVTSPYQTQYKDTLHVTNNLKYTMKANNTIMEITLPSSIKEEVPFSVSVQVEGSLYNTPRSIYSETFIPKSTKAINTLSTLVVDDADFNQTQTYDVLTGNADYINGLAPHEDTLIKIMDFNGTAATDPSYIQELIYATSAKGSTTSLTPINGNGIMYLVSPVKLTGTAQLLSVTEEYNDAGVKKTQEHQFFNTIVGFNTTNIVGTNLNAPILLTEKKVKIVHTPKNHYYTDKDNNGIVDGLNEVYGGNVDMVTGFDITPANENQISYIYKLDLSNKITASGTNSKIKKITMKLDIIGGTGSKLTGTQTFNIQ